jgi:hypothetical protein|tara:strand:+ start:1370 stop:1714 length:345 start_codon:yes stop_codon:yes gene_type:complete
MERKIEASLSIEDGVHKGVILKLEERINPYKYIDVFIEFEKGKRIKSSYPDCLTAESKLGKLLTRFGCDVSITDKVIKLDEYLLNRTCQFQTVKEGKFWNVVEGSLKPVENGNN